jgi:hypothetical protein
LHRYWLVPAPLQVAVDLLQLGPHPLRDCDALEEEASVPGCGTDVREPEEVERSRPPQPALGSSLGRIATELEEARLVGVEFQTELGKSLA